MLKQLLWKSVNSLGYSLLPTAVLEQMFIDKSSMQLEIKRLLIEKETCQEQLHASQKHNDQFAEAIEIYGRGCYQKRQHDVKNLVTHINQVQVDTLPLWALKGPYVKQQNLCKGLPGPLAVAEIHHPSAMIFSFPKSGSTVLELILSDVFEAQNIGAPFDSDIEGLRFEDIAVHGVQYPFVIKNHVWATPNNIEVLNFFNIKPIVLVRNIFDCLLSLAEDKQFFDINGRVICIGYIRKDFALLSLEERLWIVIKCYLGWYLSFYASWIQVLSDKNVNGILISYEQFMQDRSEVIKKIARHIGVDACEASITAAIEKIGQGAHTRFNKGVVGRGEKMLTREMQDAILSAAERFAPIDFSLIGLPQVYRRETQKSVANT